MSLTTVRVTPADFAPPASLQKMAVRSVGAGVFFSLVALVLAGFLHQWDLFLHSWLFSFMFWLGLTLGPLALLMLQYVTGGNWGRLGRRIWEAAAGNLWLVFLFWLPIAFGMRHIYPWAAMLHDHFEDAVARYGADKVHYYLNPTGFWVRGFIYFAGWGLLYLCLMNWSKKEEAGEATPAKFVTVQNISGIGIMFYGLALTFASIDWTMSLYPEWWSTVWGMLTMVGQVLTTFCFTIWLLVRLAHEDPIARIFKTDYLHDFGKLLFAFVVLWAYLSFSQWIIIWSGNMLSEIRWYLMRLANGWQYFGTVLILAHFVFPFALLLSRNLKRHAKRVVGIALLVLFMRLVDLFWITAPNFYSGTENGLNNFHWVDGLMYVLCPIGMGGIWLFFFFRRLSKRSLMPVNDPHFVEMLEAKHG